MTTIEGQFGTYLDRYTASALLKEGGDVRTFLGADRERGQQVIIKVAPTARISPDARRRLEHEASVLRRLESQWTVPLLTVGDDQGLLCVVMPYVPGTTLADRLAREQLSVREAVTVGTGLLGALADAHAQGVLHRDLKPGNVIVDGRPLERVTVVDFGLARSEWLDPSIRDVPVGTARYMSPEQAGLLERRVDERADLFSAGAVLFECLAGRPLFTGATLGEVLRQQLAGSRTGLRQLGVAIPRAIDELIERLISVDARDRYQSADAALADLADIAVALDRGEAEPAVVVGLRDLRRTVAEAAFVGRDHELRRLEHHVKQAWDGRGGVVALEAESGGGKTRLLEELARRASAAGAWVLRGQAVSEAAQRPFEVLSGVSADLVIRCSTDATLATTIRDRLGARAAAACAALPELAEVFEPDPDAGGPEAFGETRTLEALRAMLANLGTSSTPAVVLLDDCQWADELTTKLLTESALLQSMEDRHTLVVIAFRSEEVGPRHPLRGLAGSSLKLPPLRPGDVERLVESMAGPVPKEAAETVVALSEGSPFMAAAVVRGLVESGALVDSPEGWQIDADAMADVRASRQAAALLARRLELLPRDTARLLSVGAVLGKEFDVGLAADLVGLGAPAVAEAVLEARRRHIVWSTEDRCVFVHDKLRETVLEQLDPEERSSLHLAAARHLEQLDPDRVFDLAYHLDVAGQHERALGYALEAAARARAQHALDLAQQQYEIAQRGASAAESDIRRQIAEGLGDTLLLRGRYEEARTTFKAAVSLADEAVDRARIEGKLGEVAFKQGDVRAATAEIEQALRTLGRWVPARTLTFVASALFEVVVQVLHTALPRLFVGRRRMAGAELELVAIRLYSRLAHAYWFGKGTVPTLWTHLRELNLAERYPPTAELAQACSEHAPVMTLVTLYRRGEAYVRRSLAIRTDLGDLWGQGQSLHFLGVVLYGASRFEDCIESCQAAVRLLERTGDRWEVNTASWHIAFSRYRLGDFAGAVEMARRVHQAGVEIGDAQARGISLGAWSKASLGRVPEDLVRSELERPADDVHTSAEVLQAEGVRLIGEERYSEATAALAQAARLVRSAGLRQEYVAPIQPWLATALRGEAATVPPWAPQRRGQLERQARRAARRGLRLARRYRNNLPHALREMGLLAAMAGHRRRARRLLDRSIAVAERQGMRYERARSIEARGQVGAEVGWAGAADDLLRGRDELSAVTGGLHEAEAVTASLIDRFDHVLEAGRDIASALSREAVFEAVHRAAQLLLRGERCVVFDVVREPEVRLVPVAGDVEGGFSEALTLEALKQGRPVRLDEAGDPSESVVLTDVRSALCAPVLVGDECVSCFYAEHRTARALFGEEEQHLAGFIATLAGAALQNAAGFAEIRTLTRTLEQRVVERTAALAQSNEQLTLALERERESSERLVRLDQLKTEFMAMAAHDLRTPMAVITGFASTLRDRWEDLAPSQRVDLLNRINGHSKRLAHFLENLLQFARIESGELGYDIAPFELVALVRRTATEQVAGASTGHEVEVVATGSEWVLGDEQRIWQVLTNLLSNAVKFSPVEQPIEVVVSRQGELVEVAVIDHGPGISSQDQETLFRKFSQVDHEVGPKQAMGAGLGLYICKSIVEAQGGRIGVMSQPGRGARFSFALPRADEPADQGEQGEGRVGDTHEMGARRT